MGEIAVARADGVLRTLLGSCIGLALYDGASNVGGLAHIVLPQSRGKEEPPGKFVDTCVPALLQEMRALAGRPIAPEARLAGGANMFATKVTDTVGKRNIEACERLLDELGIPVRSRHCGGDKGRRMMLDSHTGVVTIEIVGADPIEI
ncbi:MAG: chemotaxis protein CheD [Planctomycetota bacterium]